MVSEGLAEGLLSSERCRGRNCVRNSSADLAARRSVEPVAISNPIVWRTVGYFDGCVRLWRGYVPVPRSTTIEAVVGCVECSSNRLYSIQISLVLKSSARERGFLGIGVIWGITEALGR
jgi:hypothetical protein